MCKFIAIDLLTLFVSLVGFLLCFPLQTCCTHYNAIYNTSASAYYWFDLIPKSSSSFFSMSSFKISYIAAFCGFQSTIVLLMGQVIRHLRIMTFILQYLDDLILELVHERDDHWQNSCTMVLSQCVAVYVKMKR